MSAVKGRALSPEVVPTGHHGGRDDERVSETRGIYLFGRNTDGWLMCGDKHEGGR